MIRSLLVGVSFPMLFSSIAFAADSTPAVGGSPDEISTMPLQYRVADPWFTRATVTALGGMSTVGATMPVTTMSRDYSGQVQVGGMAIDMQGRRLGFALSLVGGSGTQVNAPVEGLERSQMTFGEARVSVGGVIANSPGVFLSAGPAVEARMSAVGSLEAGNEALASWQTTLLGAEVRSRFFLTPRVFFSGSAFLGVLPVSGYWQTVDAAPASEDGEILETGTLESSTVFAGTLSGSLRPTEWIALSTGVSVREAAYGFEGQGKGSEQMIRPFVGLDLMY